MIAIIDYPAGNIKSVQNAFGRLGCETVLTSNENVIRKAEKVIFPGVGEASTAMRYLKSMELDTVIADLKQPVLGICLGLQLLCTASEEGHVDGLGVFDHRVRKFPPNEKVPHMGWNSLQALHGPLFKGIRETDDVYFVHSYYAEIGSCTAATNDYILPFSAALVKDNFMATQFHPEKSGKVGEQILMNFLEL